MNGVSKKIELIANLAIIGVAVMIGFVFWQKYTASLAPKLPEVPVGAKLVLPEVDWAKNGRTLVLVLQEGCKYCTESAAFYQRLVRESAQRNLPLIAVLPQPHSNGKKYLNYLEVPINEIRQSSLSDIKVSGTPTLLLVNQQGEVTKGWVGKLPAEKEAEVFSSL